MSQLIKGLKSSDLNPLMSIVIILLMFVSVKSFSQRRNDTIAYVSKYPVKKGYAYWFRDKPGSIVDPSNIISVFSRDSCVFAVMEGRVKKFFKVDDLEFMMTGRKDTFVVYGNMDKFYKNVGDTIHKGDLIGTIKKDTTSDRFELYFQLIKGRTSVFCDHQIKYLQHLRYNEHTTSVVLFIDGRKVNIDNHFSFTIIHNSDTVKAKIVGHRLFVPEIADLLDYVIVFKYKNQSLVFKRISRNMLLPDQNFTWEFGIDNRPFDESLVLLSDYQYENDKSIRQLQYVQLRPMECGDGLRFVNEIKY